MGFEPTTLRVVDRIFSVSSCGRFFTSPFISFISYQWHRLIKYLPEAKPSANRGHITKRN